MSGKEGKRKGGRLAVPGFGAGGIRTLSPIPSVSGSVAGTKILSAMLYDVPVKLPKVVFFFFFFFIIT